MSKSPQKVTPLEYTIELEEIVELEKEQWSRAKLKGDSNFIVSWHSTLPMDSAAQQQYCGDTRTVNKDKSERRKRGMCELRGGAKVLLPKCPQNSHKDTDRTERRLEVVCSGEPSTKQDGQTTKDIKDNWPLIKQYKQVQMTIQWEIKE